jgi:exodeoxyribonuclease VII small subunit
MTKKNDKKDAALLYGEAMGELERILSRIESEEVDIDELATEVERAAGLVRICRDKLRTTEDRVQAVVRTFDLEEETTGPEEEDEGTIDDEVPDKLP